VSPKVSDTIQEIALVERLIAVVSPTSREQTSTSRCERLAYSSLEAKLDDPEAGA
jgi:hypothetical protein